MKHFAAISLLSALLLLNLGCAGLNGKGANNAVRLSNLKPFVPYAKTYANITGNFEDTEMLLFKKEQDRQAVIDTICFYKQLLNKEKTTFFVNVAIQDREFRNIDSIMMRMDNEIITLKAEPSGIKRETAGNNRIVEEISFTLDSATVSKILFCSQIAFQYKDAPFVQFSDTDEMRKIMEFFSYGAF